MVVVISNETVFIVHSTTLPCYLLEMWTNEFRDTSF